MLTALSTNDSLETLLKWLQHLYDIPGDQWNRTNEGLESCMPMDELCWAKYGPLGYLITLVELILIYGTTLVLLGLILRWLVRAIFSRPCQHNCGRKTLWKSQRPFAGRCEVGKHCCGHCSLDHDRVMREERSARRRVRRLQKKHERTLQRERRMAARAHILDSAPEVRCVFDGRVMKPKFLKGGKGAIIYNCGDCKSQFNPGPQHQQTVS